jgi:hypothetical protein
MPVQQTAWLLGYSEVGVDRNNAQADEKARCDARHK